jgi:hypothetical protein
MIEIGERMDIVAAMEEAAGEIGASGVDQTKARLLGLGCMIIRGRGGDNRREFMSCHLTDVLVPILSGEFALDSVLFYSSLHGRQFLAVGMERGT